MSLLSENTRRFRAAKIKPGYEAASAKTAASLIGNKVHYQQVEQLVGGRVPWWAIAVIHYRECSAQFTCNLAQGDRWDQVSRHYPSGQGPFGSFNEAAVNALRAYHNTDWSGGGTATFFEKYNGMKYANAGRRSPYVWGGTDQYTIGKVMQDHGPIEEIVDKQLGTMTLLLAMQKLDPSIQFNHDLPGQADTSRKAETVTVVSSTTGIFYGIYSTINSFEPWFVFTVAGVVILLTSFIVYEIARRKRGSV